MKVALSVFGLCMLLLASGSLARGDEPSLDQSPCINFDAGWQFRLGGQPPSASTDDGTGWRTVDLPHDFSAEGEFSPTNASGTGFLPGGIGWYRKPFLVPEALRGSRVVIEFDGVQRDSETWLNGVRLGQQPSGYVGFQYDLTAHLRFAPQTNVLVVRVDRQNVADSRWYPGSGIYRHVRLRRTAPVHLAPWGVWVTTADITPEAGDVTTTTEVVNESAEPKHIRVISQVLNPDGTVAGQADSEHTLVAGASETFSDWQKVVAPQCWSPDTPLLYALETRVLDGDTLLEQQRTPFGFRCVRFDPNHGLFVNGSPLVLKGVCLHHDGGVVGAAVPQRVLERRLRLLKGMGANAVRCCHNPMAPEFYDLCDRLGLLVMDEAFDEWEIGKRKWVEGRNQGTAERFGYSHAFAEWGERDLASMVRQHRNHPCIILWSIGNEIDYPTDPYVHPESRVDPDFKDFSSEGQPPVTRLAVVSARLIAAVKRQDPTRPVTMALANVPAANGIGLASMLDVAGYNYQESLYEPDHRQFPNRVLFGSENSRSVESWLAVKHHEYVAGLFLWVGFDFLGEASAWPAHGSMAGLFDNCGFIKPVGLQFEALWKETPVLHLLARPASPAPGSTRGSNRLSSGWQGQPGQSMEVTAFSNCRKVELRLNGRSLGVRRPGEDRSVHWQVPFEAGELVALGRPAKGAVIEERLRTAGAPARIQLLADRTELSADGADAAQIEIRAVDEQGTLVPNATCECHAQVTGAGQLAGLGNGDQLDPTPLTSSSRNLRHGRALAILRSRRQPGPLTLVITAPGLPEARLQLNVHEGVPLNPNPNRNLKRDMD